MNAKGMFLFKLKLCLNFVRKDDSNQDRRVINLIPFRL